MQKGVAAHQLNRQNRHKPHHGEASVHPLRITTPAEGRHIAVSRQGQEKGQIDEALSQAGLERKVATIVGSFSAALALVRSGAVVESAGTDLPGVC